MKLNANLQYSHPAQVKFKIISLPSLGLFLHGVRKNDLPTSLSLYHKTISASLPCDAELPKI